MRRKQLEYIIQNQQFSDMAEDAGIAAWLADFRLWDDENEEEIRPNEIQRHDLNLTIQKRYTLLQWEQGTGKTLAGIAVGLYRMQRREVYHTWVVSTAISIRNNWDLVLPNYGLSYVLVERLSDLERIQPGDFVLITLNKLGEYRRQIKRWVRMHNRKVQLVFDESDEMSNPASIRTKAVLACFRRCRYKLLETGTSTRNNIVEFAPQAELLYNNSVNMLSWCKTLYRRDRKTGDLSEEYNPFYGTPIPAYAEARQRYLDKDAAEHAAKVSRRQAEDAAYCAERNAEAQQQLDAAINTIRTGGELKNEAISIYRGRYDCRSYSIINHLARQFGVQIPLKVQGWINKRLIHVVVRNGAVASVCYSGSPSRTFHARMNELIASVLKQQQDEETR